MDSKALTSFKNNGSNRIVRLRGVTILGFCHGYFFIRICFVFRASDFDFKWSKKLSSLPSRGVP